jgi:peptide/nickel transport system permease protein
MLKYILKRLASLLLILLVVSVLVFFVIRLVPGDPIQLMFGKSANPERVAEVRALYGLDKPVWQQYFIWMGNLLKGNWGTSIRLDEPVIDLVLERLPRTALLCVLGILLSLAIAIPSGVIAAIKKNTIADVAITTGNLLFISVPSFLCGILLIVVFSVNLQILPATGYVSPLDDLWGSIRSLVLPTIAMAACFFAALSRLIRSSMLEVLNQDYITLARIKGNKEARVHYVHALKNALIPAITMIGLQIGYFLGGEIVVEKVFAFPGMGMLMLNALTQLDYPLIQATMLVFTIIIVVVNMLTDIAYMLVDPKIRYGHAKMK